MIIFGTRGVTYTHQTGEFHCPGCDGPSNYRHRRVRRFFTLYFIPIIPLDLLSEYIECRRCQGTYELGVLSYDPAAERDRFKAQYELAILRVMVIMMLADGVIEDEEVATIARVFGSISGSEITEDQIRAEAHQAGIEGVPAAAYVQGMAHMLNDSGKELVIKAAFLVAAADGDFQDEERALLGQIANAMEVSAAHLRGILDTLVSTSEDATAAAG